MPSPEPLPRALRGRAFTLADAAAYPVTEKRLRASDLQSPSRDIRAPAGELPLAEHARAVLALTPDGWVSHASAGQLHGFWLPTRLASDSTLHISRGNTCEPARRRRVRGHAARVTEEEITTVGGLRIATRARAWFELLPALTLAEAVIIGDQLIRRPRRNLDAHLEPWCARADLSHILELNEWRAGVVLGREALALVRQGSDSPPETRLRLAIIEAGLPEPQTQLRLDPDDPHSPEADLGYRRERIALQYEGAHHRDGAQLSSDIRRDEAWVGGGRRVLRADAGDQRTDFVRVTTLLRRLLAERAA